MSQNLTQPEEIEQALKTMAVHGAGIDKLLPNACWPNLDIKNKGHEFSVISGHSCCTASSKQACD